MDDHRGLVPSIMRWHKATYAVGLLMSALLCGVAGWFAATRFEALLPEDAKGLDALPRVVRAVADEPIMIALLALPAVVAAIFAFACRKRTGLFILLIVLGSGTLFLLFGFVLYSFLTLLAPDYQYDGTL